MKLCFNSQNNLLIHSDGDINKCCTSWIGCDYKSNPIDELYKTVNICQHYCNIIPEQIECVDILLNYKCLPNCNSCNDSKTFKNAHINKTISIETIVKTLAYIFLYINTINTITIGSFFDSTNDIELLSRLINIISYSFKNINIKIYHTGITSLAQLSKLLSTEAIKKCIFIINFNGDEYIQNLYKPNSFEIIYNNIRNNIDLKLQVNCILYEQSLTRLNKIFLNLDNLDKYVDMFEIKFDDKLSRLNKSLIISQIAYVRYFYYNNRNIIISKKLKHAIKNCILSNGNKSKFKLKIKSIEHKDD